MTSERPWRDLVDPRRAETGNDLETGLKEPLFENLKIPERLGPAIVRIDDHKIKRFAFTQDDHHPWHLVASPFDGRRVAHAALLGNDLLQLFTTVYAASHVVGLHTEEQLWFDSPAYLDEEVKLDGTYTETFERRGQQYVVMDAIATGEDGRSILRHRGVEIFRTVPGNVAGQGTASHAGRERQITGEIPAEATAFNACNPAAGQVLDPLTKTFTVEQAAVFSRIGEYVKNIHNDLATAREAGLPVPIVQGQQLYGAASELLTRSFGVTWFTGGQLQLKFIKPVQVHEEVTIFGLIRQVQTDSVVLDVWLRRADGAICAAGQASAPRP